MAPDPIPRATYRLQFNRQFTFDDAVALVPYLQELGVSHCYASPYLKARSGSPHGYDIVDHNALNPEIGDDRSFGRFVTALARHGMGHILDFVPNHMGVGGDDNAWWLDLLENGQASSYADFFDIDWHPHEKALRGKVLVPFLGGYYGDLLENGELHLAFDAQRGEFSVWYLQHRFPLDPRTYPGILEYGLERLKERLGADQPRLAEYQSLSTAFTHLPARRERAAAKLEERRRDKEVHKRHLAELCTAEPRIGAFIEENVASLNGEPGEAATFDRLHEVLEGQAYRLAYWRVAADEINYRRFFDINDLAGLRMERPEVFAATHRLVLQLVAEGKLDGLRIDHADGLYDPAGYFTRLRMEIHAALAERAEPAGGGTAPDFYLVAEKILIGPERLVDGWPVQGTTGYDFANAVNDLFVNPAAQRDLDRIYARFIGQRGDFAEMLFQCKQLVMEAQLSSELTMLADMLDGIAQSDRHTRDFTRNGCRGAVAMLVACFPVYRSYIAANRVSEDDRRYVEAAVAQAKKRSPGDVSIFDFIRRILLEDTGAPEASRRRRAARFALKLQQYTAPVMAKAQEDTAFYRYHRLVSLNEVGGDPRRFGTTPAAFHRANQERAQKWPYAMLTTSTHDTKRSEDVRARIDVLSELTDEWRKRVGRWARFARRHKRMVDGIPAPSRNDEYLFYQTLLGVWPLESPGERAFDDLRERVLRYMLKAVKEAKTHTSWLNPNLAYEEALDYFVMAMLDRTGRNPFLADFLPFQARVARFGLWNGLSQQLLKLTAPGVPDIYQGTEVWDFSLVDPDNRRPVDYRRRRDLLHRLRAVARGRDGARLAQDLMEHPEDGRAKLFVTWRALEARHRFPEVFAGGAYLPLAVTGAQADHAVAFARQANGRTVITIANRWFATLLGDEKRLPVGEAVWTDTGIELPDPAAAWENLFTGETVRPDATGDKPRLSLARTLACFPVALLVPAEVGS